MTTSFKMARGLVLPEDAVTQTVAFLARKGNGKTYAAGRFAEGLYDIGGQFVVIDPVGSWWGLRAGADGKSEGGLQVVVLGGEHCDVDVSAESGGDVARMLIDRGVSAIVDVSNFRKAERRRFVGEFCEELYYRAKKTRSPLMVIFEEAQVFAPQRSGGGDARMLGAVEDIVRLGRNHGIGSTLLSQRPQSVNKEVLNQVECLFVGQLNASHERKAIEDWIKEKGVDLDTSDLPSLDVGWFYVWSPQWLKTFRRVKVLKKRTFDSSATPKLGKATKPKGFATVDVEAIRKALTKGKGKGKTKAPKPNPDLERRVRELEEENAQIKDRVRCLFSSMRAEFDTFGRRFRERFAEFADNEDFEPLKTAPSSVSQPEPSPARMSTGSPARTGPRKRTRKQARTGDEKPLRAGAREMLRVLWAAGGDGLEREALAVQSVMSPKGGAFSSYLSKLRRRGLIEEYGGRVYLDDSALSEINSHDRRLPTANELVDKWGEKGLRRGARIMIHALIEVYPSQLHRTELAERTNMEAKGGAFSSYLSKLRRAGLIVDMPGGYVTASGSMFKGERR